MQTYTVELTREEAVALMMLRGACGGFGVVESTVNAVADALYAADPTLERAQFKLWQRAGEPHFQLEDRINN